MRVLVVEDDRSAAERIRVLLDAERYICDVAEPREEAFDIGKRYDYDIILLDPILFDTEGLEVLRLWRTERITTPVLILSCLTSPEFKIKALAMGADDYLVKPFDDGELIARIQAIVRRAHGHDDSIIRAGKLAINLLTRRVKVEDRPVHLTGKEYGIVELLFLRKGMTITKESLANHLYHAMEVRQLKAIDVFVCELRKKLAAATGGDNYIETVWGRGYVLRDPEDDR